MRSKYQKKVKIPKQLYSSHHSAYGVLGLGSGSQKDPKLLHENAFGFLEVEVGLFEAESL